MSLLSTDMTPSLVFCPGMGWASIMFSVNWQWQTENIISKLHLATKQVPSVLSGALSPRPEAQGHLLFFPRSHFMSPPL